MRRPDEFAEIAIFSTGSVEAKMFLMSGLMIMRCQIYLQDANTCRLSPRRLAESCLACNTSQPYS